jgi:hypothetical protein
VNAADEPTLAREGSRGSRPAWLPPLFLVALFFLGVAIHRWPSYSVVKSSTGRFTNGVMESIFQCLSQMPPPRQIRLTQSGPIPFENIELWFQVRHQHPAVSCNATAQSAEKIMRKLRQADLIIAQDKGYEGTINWLPAEAFQDEIVASLKNNPAYRVVLTCPDPQGKLLYVFQRIP